MWMTFYKINCLLLRMLLEACFFLLLFLPCIENKLRVNLGGTMALQKIILFRLLNYSQKASVFIIQQSTCVS